MGLQEDLNRIKELNAEIENLSRKLRQTPTFFKKDQIDQAENFVKFLENQLKEIDSDLNFIAESFRRSVQELSKQNTFLNQGKKSLRDISSISSQLLNIKYGEVDADSESIKKLKVKAKLRFNELNQAIRLMETQEGLTDAQKLQLAELKGAAAQQAAFIRGQEEVLNLQKRIEKSGGVKIFSGLEEISKAIPGLSKFTSGFQDAAKAAKDAARQNELNKEAVEKRIEAEKKIRNADLDTLKIGLEKKTLGKGMNKELIERLGLSNKLVGIDKKGNKVKLEGSAAASKLKTLMKGGFDLTKNLKPLSKLPKSISPLKAGFKALGPMIKKALGPLTLILEFIKGIGKADKQIVELQKSMALPATEAVKFRSELIGAAAATGDINITATGLNETFASLNKQFGFIAKFSTDTLVTTTKLTKVVGIGAEAANNLAAATVSSGVEFESAYKNSLGISYELQRQEGVQFDLRDILEESGKITGVIRANLKANIENIAEAVTTAKLFGATLNEVAGAGRQLLDFEQSITNELKAELLLGKNLNLERARLAALNGDLTTLGEELRAQAGDFTEFSAMNVIQQEALAAAVGMQADQLADVLFKQDVQGKTAEELRAAGKDELADMLEKQTMQEKFNASVVKLQEIFTDVFTAISPILNIIVDIVKVVGLIVKPIGALIAGATKLNSFLGITVSLLVAAGLAALFLNGMVTLGIGIAIALAAIGGGMAYFESNIERANDMYSGYGKRALYNEGELTLLNDRDTVIAGTDLFKPVIANDMISMANTPSPIEPIMQSETIKEITVSSPPPQPNSDAQELIAQNRTMISLFRENFRRQEQQTTEQTTAIRDNKPVVDTFGERYG